MKTYMKIMVMGLMLLIMSIGNGCASYMVYKSSEQKVLTRKTYARGDQAAIKAVQLGDDGVGIGIDVTNWEALKEQPLLQFGAAILDAGMIYGSYRGIDSMNNDDEAKDIEVNVNGDGNNTTINTGDSNSSLGNPDNSEDNSE